LAVLTYVSVTVLASRVGEDGAAKENAGFEFSVSVRGSVPGDTSLALAEGRVVSAVQKAVGAILNGDLQ
jgi:hypothetical protein